MNIRHITSDFVISAKNFTRSREAVFFTLIFPVLLIAIFGSIFSSSGSGSVPLYVQNMNGNTQLTESFLSALNATHLVSLHFIPANVKISSYISSNSVTAALQIPSTFTSSVLSGGYANLSFYYNPAQSSSQIAEQAIDIVVQQMNLHLSHTHDIIGIAGYTNSIVATSYVDYLIPGLIGFTILTSPMFSQTYVVSSYKKEKIFRQLSLTPLTRSEWMVSRFLWYISISMVSAAEMIALGYFAFNAHIRLTWLIIPFILLGVLLFVSLGTIAGSVAKSEEGASVIGNIITFPMMFLAGTFFPISIMPGWLQEVAHVLPLYYVIDGLNSVMVYANYAAAMLDFIITLSLTLAFLLLAITLFSWRET